jgi:hypothetical protein
MGAGDGRFAMGGQYEQYVGVEIDAQRAKMAKLPRNARLHTGCIFQHFPGGYDACIGNPPYVRHHDIESPWRERIVKRIAQGLGFTLNRNCNLFVYFICLAILKSQHDGIVALLIPHEWVSRPSVEPLRRFLKEKKWGVDVYRFVDPIFSGVLTTASITIIDKKDRTGIWRFFDIDSKQTIRPRKGPSAAGSAVLQYADRGPIWAMRGLSPGAQPVFTLTEGQRIHYGLSLRDVAPCVTTLKHVPGSVRTLTMASFKRYFVEQGARCWLIRSYSDRRSAALNAYLSSVPKDICENYTCRNRELWYCFTPHPVPDILVSSGFTAFGPKVVRNLVAAHAVGAVMGVHVPQRFSLRKLLHYLLTTNFEGKIVPHAKTLKKLEVRQMNAALNTYCDEIDTNDE